LQFIMQTPFVVILLSVAAESAWLPPPIDLNQQVTLDGGRQPGEGNVLINGRPVCDDMWDDKDAEVVCRMLGYNSGQATSYSTFGQVDTSFIMDDVQCSGYETNITYCPHNSQHNCASYEGAGVRCHQIKLTGGSDYSEGNVLINGKPICDDDWDNRDAAVICRMIGFWSGVAVSNSAFGQVDDDFVMDDVKCGGDETNIFGCVFESQHNCGGHEGAGVRCEEKPSNNDYGSTTTTRYETTTTGDQWFPTTISDGQCLLTGHLCMDDSYNSLGPCCEGRVCTPDNSGGYGGGYCFPTATTGDDFWTTTTTTTVEPCIASGSTCWENFSLVGSGMCCSTNSVCDVQNPMDTVYCP